MRKNNILAISALVVGSVVIAVVFFLFNAKEEPTPQISPADQQLMEKRPPTPSRGGGVDYRNH